VEDHVHARLVLAERDLLAAPRIAERLRRHPGVLRDDGAVGAHVADAGAVASLELVDERDVHTAHEADALRAADERGQRADEKGAFLLAELERGEVGRRRDGPAGGVEGDGEIDAGELDLRILLREQREVVGEDEPDADDEVHPLGGEEAEAGLAIGALTGLDEADARAELPVRALGAAERAVVERLVSPAADVEHDTDVEPLAGGELLGTARPHEQQRGVHREEHAEDEEELAHGP
jgi:hypothetical protein